jgi:SAM-dependent methyltransferase
MFWFDRKDSRATFVDIRREQHTLPDISSKGGSRELVIDPDYLADFVDLPFPDNTFALVVFDPPHLQRNGATGWVGLKYGTLKGDWRNMLSEGFAECFRVLRPEGVLIFKWCEDEIPVSHVLALTPERPLFGHKSGKQQKTHWVTFMKSNENRGDAMNLPGDMPFCAYCGAMTIESTSVRTYCYTCGEDVVTAGMVEELTDQVALLTDQLTEMTKESSQFEQNVNNLEMENDLLTERISTLQAENETWQQVVAQYAPTGVL